MTNDTNKLPDDVVERLLAVGKVEWGRSFEQSDGMHVEDFQDTLSHTRDDHGIKGDTHLHYVCPNGTSTVLCQTGTSPNSGLHATIIAAAWNNLVDLAEAQRNKSPVCEGDVT